MSIEDADAPLTIVEAGRQRVLARMRSAFAEQVVDDARLGTIDADELDALISEAADRAGDAVWRISLAEGAADEFGLSVADTLDHPSVVSAAQLVGVGDGAELPDDAPAGPPTDELDADPWPEPEAEPDVVPEPEPERPEPEPEPEPAAAQAIRVNAVHLGGIDALPDNDKDLALRLSDAGLDVLRRSGDAIGRLDWTDITDVELDTAKKGIGRRKSQTLLVRTGRGLARFELPGLSDEEAAEKFEPMLARLRGAGHLPAAATE